MCCLLRIIRNCEVGTSLGQCGLITADPPATPGSELTVPSAVRVAPTVEANRLRREHFSPLPPGGADDRNPRPARGFFFCESQDRVKGAGAETSYMNVEVACSPSYALAYLRLNAGETVYCEPGSMVAMSMGVELNARVDGNVLSSALRNIVGGESFFLTRLRGQMHGVWVAVAPRFPGDVAPVVVDGSDPLTLQAGSYLAHEDSVEVNVRLSKPGEFLLREGATLLELAGHGQAVICSYGGMQRIDLNVGEQLVVDTSHLVAWSSSLNLRIGPLTGLVSSQFTSEGLVGRFTAESRPGHVVIQTRAEQTMRDWLFPDREMNRR